MLDASEAADDSNRPLRDAFPIQHTDISVAAD